MLYGALDGSLKALYVVGANPVKTYRVEAAERLGGLELLVVQDLFLTETAKLADVVFPAACAYEKEGTVTNTAGQVQFQRKALDPPAGARSDFDILRILSHQLAKAGLGTAMHFRTPEAVFDEIRQHVRGYDLSWTALLAGGAETSAPEAQLDGAKPFDAPAEGVFSARDTLFTSGTLGRYCTMIRSCPEANE
jgi:predicted molibdopterin-dependent oxidoreductase YjgC